MRYADQRLAHEIGFAIARQDLRGPHYVGARVEAPQRTQDQVAVDHRRAVVLGVLAGSGRVGEHEIVVRYTTARAER